MDFKDYINELNSLENQEAKAELQTFYMLHASTFKFFKAIDNTIQELLKQPNVSKIAIEQLNGALPTLKKLRNQISKLDTITFLSDYKTIIDQQVIFIKNEMTLAETENTIKKIQELLESNNKALEIERTEKQKNKDCSKKITPLQRAESLVLSQGLSNCDAETLWMLAEKSKNAEILEMIAKENPKHTRIKSIQEAYGADSILEIVADNPKINLNTYYILAKDRDAKYWIAKNKKTPLELLSLLACDSDELVRSNVAENPKTPHALLTTLSYDKSDYVRIALTHNPNTPIDALWRLFNLGFKVPLAENKNIPIDMILLLANEKNPSIIRRLLDNPSTPLHVREQLTKKSEGCFVATACYGDYDAPEVLVLRKYRDEQLLTNWIGSLFVKFYYFVSPPLAKRIEKSDKMKQFIRKYFLKPIIIRIQNNEY